MRPLQSLSRRLQSLFHNEMSNVALNEELQFHLDRQIEENIRAGMSPAQAKDSARLSFGSFHQAIEDSYQARGIAWIEDLIQDVRYSLRTLMKDRSFTIVILLTLALGIGSCTAIFSLVNAVLLRSLPYGQADKLVYLFTPNPHLDLPPEMFGPSYADFVDLRKQSRSYAQMTLFEQRTYNLAVNDEVQRVGAARVDGYFFQTLQSAPEIGRVIDASDQKSGNNQIVVLGFGIWQQLFGGTQNILGKTIRLDDKPYQVVGVMPRDFGFPHKSDVAYGNGHIVTTQLWVPLTLTPREMEMSNRDISNGFAIARLNHRATREEAQAEMSSIMSRLDLLHTSNLHGWGALVVSFRGSAFGPVKRLMWLLLGAVGIVLLISCGNAANLLLARAANRTHEFGIRVALGARTGRIFRQMLAESLMLGAAAGTLGIALAYLLLHLLLKLSAGDIPRMEDATLDARVIAFLAGITLLTSLIFGVLPSLSATQVNATEFLKSGGTRGVIGSRSHTRRSLAVGQVALVVVLLTGAGLLLRSYAKLVSVPTGFATSTITMNVQLGPQYDTTTKRMTFFRQVIDRVKLIRGIQAIGAANYLPLSNTQAMTSFEVQDYPNDKGQLAESRTATEEYLSALGISISRGRGFTGDDIAGHPAVAIVNTAFAKKYFGRGGAIGHHLRESPTAPWTTIVGEIGDIRNMSLEAAVVPQIYQPFWQNAGTTSAYIAVRSSLPRNAVTKQLQAAVHSRDGNLALSDILTMDDLVTQNTARRRFQTTLLTLVSVIAMSLALVGVYGLLAYSVRRRTREIGVRIVLGASKLNVAGLVLKEGLGILGVGIVIGMIGAVAGTRLLTGLLYDVPAIDPVTFTLVPVLLLVATVLACLIPSCRAASVDPINVLRSD